MFSPQLLHKKERSTCEKLADLMTEDDNRQRLREHMDIVRLPCIPYLGEFKAANCETPEATGHRSQVIDAIASVALVLALVHLQKLFVSTGSSLCKRNMDLPCINFPRVGALWEKCKFIFEFGTKRAPQQKHQASRQLSWAPWFISRPNIHGNPSFLKVLELGSTVI